MSQEKILSIIDGENFEFSLQCQETADQFSFNTKTNWNLGTGRVRVKSMTNLPGNTLETVNFEIEWTKAETNYSYLLQEKSPGSTSEQKGDEPGTFHPEFSKTLGPLTFRYGLPSPQKGLIFCEYNGVVGKIQINAQRLNDQVSYTANLPGRNISHISKIMAR